MPDVPKTARELIEAAKAAHIPSECYAPGKFFGPCEPCAARRDMAFRAEDAFEACLEALRYAEWCGVETLRSGIGVSACPYCAAHENVPHMDGCLLRRALAAADGVKEGT